MTELDTGLKLLEPLRKTCLSWTDGWWKYEWCHKRHVKQYHHRQFEGDLHWEYYLGKKPTKLTVDALRDMEAEFGDEMETVIDGEDPFRGKRRVIVLRMGNGTVCDLTGKPRRVEVHIRCSPTGEEKVLTVREVGTCSYELHIHTHRLCTVPAFSGEAFVQPNKIQCRPVVTEEEYQRALSTLKLNNRTLEGLDGPKVEIADPREEPLPVPIEEKKPEEKVAVDEAAIKKALEKQGELLNKITKSFAKSLGLSDEELKQATQEAEAIMKHMQTPQETRIYYVDKDGNVKAKSPDTPKKEETIKDKRTSTTKRPMPSADDKTQQDKREKLRHIMKHLFGVVDDKKPNDKEHDEL
jgi:protein OS-9